MPAEPAPEPTSQPATAHRAYALPQTPTPERPSGGEWAIGIVFVLAALAIVALIALAITRLPA